MSIQYCKSCGKEINVNQQFCHHCGTAQVAETVPPPSNVSTEPKSLNNFLLFLCIATILGSLFGIGRGFIYEMVAEVADNGEYVRGWIYILTNAATLTGAILMLQKKFIGLQVYTAGQVIYILTVIAATFVYDSENYFEGAETIAVFISFFFLIPSIVFLLLYWLAADRSQLV